MKIVHVISGLGRGGAERTLLRLIEGHQGSLQFQHEVISLSSKGVHGIALEREGVVVHTLGMNKISRVPFALIQLFSLLRRIKPDIVQTWMYHADLLGGVIARLACRSPILWGIHSFDLKRGGSRATRLVQRLCAALSASVPSRIFCVAESSRDLHVSLGYQSTKFEVIPNGFDITTLSISIDRVVAFREKYGFDSYAMVIGCVGRFSPAKDHRNFIHACSLVAHAEPNARFLMVGQGLVADNQVLAAWLADSGMAERFVLLGERDDVSTVLSAMDVFCSSSRTEAFPLVVGEAMVLARPCVVTDVGDTRFLVGDTAIVVPSEDPQSLAEGLLRVLRLPATERAAMGQCGQQRVCNHFSFEKILQRIEVVYLENAAAKENS